MHQYVKWGAAYVALAAWGCDGSGDLAVRAAAEGESGTLRAALSLPVRALDVSGLRIAVLPPGADCAAQPLFESTPPWASEALPEGQGLSGDRPFASALFVLSPGDYRVCATPLAGDGPSDDCGVASADATITAGQTTRLVLTSECAGAGSGGADVIVALNGPPRIEDVVLEPGRFISRCESLAIDVTASDPDDDPLDYTFAASGGALRANAGQASFSAAPGDYTVSVEVRDPHGASADLSFPVHVSDATCAVPSDVQAIFTARCAPCHTSGASGGLSLASGEASYAGLVGMPSSAAACAARLRVLPGAPEQSYLMAKLGGAPDICGGPMPRGRPALPAEELDAIAAWIAGLPH